MTRGMTKNNKKIDGRPTRNWHINSFPFVSLGSECIKLAGKAGSLSKIIFIHVVTKIVNLNSVNAKLI